MHRIQEKLVKEKPNFMRQVTLQELLKTSSKPCTRPGTETPTFSPRPLPDAHKRELSFIDPLSTSRPASIMNEMHDVPLASRKTSASLQ